LNTYSITLLVALALKVIVETLLGMRNASHIQKNKNQIPEELEGFITPENHVRASNYNIHKIKSSLLFGSIEFVVFLGWIFGGYLNRLDIWLSSVFPSELAHGISVIFLFGFISSLIAIPETLYATFVIEEKHGFNRTTWKTWLSDFLKSILLSIVLGLPLIASILWIMHVFSTSWWLVAFLLVMSYQLMIYFLYPWLIAPLFNKFTPLENGELTSRITALGNRMGFFFKNIMVMDASRRSGHSNAFFTGLGRNKRIVLFDTLVQILDPGQIEAVLAHEMGHYKKRHVAKGLIKSALLSLAGFYVLSLLMQDPAFYSGFMVQNASYHIAFLLFFLVAPVFTFFLTPLSSYLSRRDEFEADRFALEFSSGEDLSSALTALFRENKSVLFPDPWSVFFYYSHPPILDRIHALKKSTSLKSLT
jgi:STE24 endopeptidase